MSTRHAVEADIPQIVAMGSRFIDSEYAGYLTFSPRTIADFAQRLITGAGVVFLAEAETRIVGMMAMTTYPHPFSGETIATEVVWWMEPEARGGSAALRLFAESEAWARSQGATKLQMIAPSDHVAQFYERIGFERIEVHYQKALTA